MPSHICAKCGKVLTLSQSNEPCPYCGSRDRIVFDVDVAVLAEKEAAAEVLAKKHYELETGLSHVFRITTSAKSEVIPSEPIKLLEVNENTVESGVMPLSFGPMPTRGINFPTTIIEVTPNEFRRIQSQELRLPEGWQIREELPRPVDNPGGP